MATFGGVTYFLKVDQAPEVHASTFSKLPVHALIHDPQKKLHASTRAPVHTFAKLPVHALINDLKNWIPKKLIVSKWQNLVV